MPDHVRQSTIVILMVGSVISLILAFAPAALWTELFSLI